MWHIRYLSPTEGVLDADFNLHSLEELLEKQLASWL